jgi:spore coat protein CotF
MSSYKTEVTLNEKDSLQDMLNAEKNLVKLYALALSEGVSKGFRNLIKEHFIGTADDQLKVFLTMTECDYYRVQSASEEQLATVKQGFQKAKSELS